MNGIEIKSLYKNYGNVVAVNGINLSVQKGQFMTLLGPSGSGKTTTLRMVGGLEMPLKGTIAVNGRTLNGDGVVVAPHKRNMGMVFQSYAVWPHKTVYENVVFPLRMRQSKIHDERERVEKMLALVGLEFREYGNRYPSQLSGGQQQRVALARALVGDPEVLLYDEPLSNLDARLRDSMRILMRSIHDQLGVTSLYVTHDQVEAMVLSDQICVMNHGQIVQQGSPVDLYEKPENVFVAEFIGQANVLPVLRVDRSNNQVILDEHLPVNIAPGNLRTVGDDAVQLIIRHHQVKLHSQQSVEKIANTFTAKVLQNIYLGDRMRFVLQLSPRCKLIAESVPFPNMPQVGMGLVVELPAESCIVL